ncbi:hypothetical protein J6590_034313 [Homalodisca vitripennis]|nr:hypothetical protein J6590_034313 [Homalodisca vitripennis]
MNTYFAGILHSSSDRFHYKFYITYCCYKKHVQNSESIVLQNTNRDRKINTSYIPPLYEAVTHMKPQQQCCQFTSHDLSMKSLKFYKTNDDTDAIYTQCCTRI